MRKDVKSKFDFDRESSAWRILLLADLGKTFDGTIKKSDIMKKYNFRSRQAMHHYETMFVKNGLLEVMGKYPKTYALSKLAISIVKKILEPSETMKDVWRFHYYIRGYKIKNWGTWNFSKHKIVPMNNWDYVTLEVDIGHKQVIKAHIQTTGTLKVYSPPIYGSEYGELKPRARNICDKVARKLSETYGLSITEGYDVRKKGDRSHYALINSQKLGRLLINLKDPRFWVDFSLGTEEVETNDPIHIQNVLDMPQRVAELQDALLNKVNPTLELFSEQLARHLKVLQGIENGLKRQTELFEKIEKSISKGNGGVE